MILRGSRERAIRALIGLILLLCCAAVNAENENYGWPLQNNYGISATFGEFRDDHFHAGIDFSTNGDVGLPVLSIADGKIVRLKIQKRAYGKAIYVLHPNGITSVYAHLSAYSSALGVEQIYQAKVQETGNRYPGDVFIDPPIPVHKGDVIAFSGETGAGFPHLHMELRRDEVAINPLLNGFKDTMDPVPPTFEAVYLYPLDATSAVDGDLETEEIRLQKGDSDFRSDHVPVVRGSFMASVSVYDAAERPYHRSPHTIAMSIDGRSIYTVQFDEMSYALPSYFGLIYDLGKPGSSFYEYPVLMNRLVNAQVPFVLNSVPFSTQNLTPGTHTLEIQASDANNNTSVAHLDFIVNHPPAIQILNANAAGNDLVVHARVSDSNWQSTTAKSLAAEMEFSIDGGKQFLPFQSASLQSNQKQTNDFEFRVPMSQIQNSSSGNVFLKARAFDGIEYSPYVIVALDSKTLQSVQAGAQTLAGKLRAITYSNAVKIIFDSDGVLASPVIAQAGPGVTIPLQSVDLMSHQAIIAAPKSSGQLSFSVGTHQVSLPLNYINIGAPAKVSGENFDLMFDADTLLWDTFVWTKPIPTYKARYLPPVGSMVQLGPRGVPFKKDATLVFHYPAEIQNSQKLSIYNWSRNRQKWVSLPSTVDAASRTVQTHIKVLDMYALIYDNVPPVITPVFPKRRTITRDKTPKLAAQVDDAGMLVDDEKVTFFVDKTAYQAEYDPDRNLATVQIETPLKKGYHRFWVQVFDYGGNETRSPKITFRVK